MDIKELQQQYALHPNVVAMGKLLRDSSVKTISMEGLRASAAPLYFSTLLKNNLQTFLFILSDAEEAGYFYHDLTQVNGDENVLFFPSSFRRAVKYRQKDAGNEVLRADVLSRLQKGDNVAIVTYPEALAEMVVSSSTLSKLTIQIAIGNRMDTEDLIQQLLQLGFVRVDYVYEPGQFALRGSILDIFSYSSEYPYRVDFFDDEVDSIRMFEVESQLSVSKQQQIVVLPKLDNVGEGEMTSFLNLLPTDAAVALKDYTWVYDRIRTTYEEAVSSQAKIESEWTDNPEQIKIPLLEGTEFSMQMLSFKWIEFGTKPSRVPQAVLKFQVSQQPLFHKNFDLVCNSFNDYLLQDYTIYICTDSEKQAKRLKAIFEDRNESIQFTYVNKTLHEGFVDVDLKACFFTDHQIFDRFHKYNLRSDKARSGKIALTLKELSQFEPGDFVVHIDHGVGKFAGLVRLPNGNSTQEVIKLVFKNDDVVFVSIHSLHKISKYKGKEGEPPKLNKLGTGAWEKLKDNTKRKIKDIARDLIKLYSMRKQEKGFCFSADSFMQRELEASFLYEDTPDQLKATQDVKADMESAKPMDRLVCGDVGFGKTEVAIRAAFKAVTDNKQVAVLVPTTVLAYQHFQTFSERLKDFPCKVEYISRSRTGKALTAVLKDLEEGKINIIIGTHKLIGKNVKFKDLGLLIIDEEQKFGVSTKEKLRQLRVNVDTLTMTATPIPRTLQFSLMGARDLSVIQTPPPNRYPIQTEVHVFNEEVIADAINFEMSRNGQVFFINNRIQNLEEMKALIVRNVPDCRVAIGHGQMEPEKLEKIIYDFVNYDYDVLVATTIVESGIDIPNANTIIINQAQYFGLSDLHQMRGRVGRSNKKAFCYLMAPPMSSLTQEARRRLQAIENFSDLGSGIHIAMQDLDIRGAGNMLGAEQSGFIADLGYETYQKILNEAVKELKEEEFVEVFDEEVKQTEANGQTENICYVDECQLESDLELLFPNEYIPSSSERMLLYRRLDSLENDQELANFRSELEDRFGKIPDMAEDLLCVVPLRRMARELGIEKITLKQERMFMYFVYRLDSPFYQSKIFELSINYMSRHPRNTNLREQNGKRSMVIREITSIRQAVEVLKNIQNEG